MLSSMLDVEAAREWETDGLLLYDEVTLTGDSKVELARGKKNEDEETGEIKVVYSRGSVTHRCTGGREVVYGVKLLVVCEVDNMRRCVLFGPPADEEATAASCGLIFGSNVGPCCRSTGDLLGVVRAV